MMIRVDDFSKMLSGELDILKQQTVGLTTKDSLLQPQPGGNCLNWVMGHLVVNLVEILEVLEVEVAEDVPDLTRYRIGSEPILGEEAGVLALDDLVDIYEQLTNKIVDRLSQMNEADFEEEIDFWQAKSRRGYVAFFYFFHNTYHLGQLEYLRNLAGKTEKVI
ncbi:MAG TPA: DinB family protein [Brevefilum sp.]